MAEGGKTEGRKAKNGLPTQTMPRSGHVSQVRNKWMSFEDYSLASGLQDQEFEQHYDHNRSERRQVGGDVRVSKEEQKMEDIYAAEYWEQVRLDREKEDEALARQMQEQLEMEERRKLKQLEAHDSKMAARIVEYEKQKKAREFNSLREVSAEDERIAAEMQGYLASMGPSDGATVGVPLGLTQDTWSLYKNARREGRSIQLPNGMSPEQREAIEKALREEDRRMAQEAQDAELARYLQRQEQKRLSKEQVDNELNQVAAVIGPKEVKRTENLINFDDDVPTSTQSKNIIRAGYSNDIKSAPSNSDFRPPRPPPPKISSNESENGIKKNIAAMGGIRVLPPADPDKKYA